MRICPQCRQRTEERRCPACDITTVDEQGLTGEDLVGKVFAERYEVVSLLGRGGMGAVYKARHLAMGSAVALKVLRREAAGDLEAIERFYREAKAASQLTHVNTIKVFDFGQSDDGQLFIAMEYLDGVSLRGEMTRSGPLDAARICRIAGQVCKSLGEAHEMVPPIIHRDIKPENIFLTKMSRETDFVKVLDFGIAKSPGGGAESLTQDGTAMGTPRYMSPEQARASRIDGRSDLYSLGVVMYEMAAGLAPFEGNTPMRLVLAHIHDPPPPLAAKYPFVHTELAGLIMALLEKDPYGRPRTADEVLSRLRVIRKSLPTTTPVPARKAVAPQGPPPSPRVQLDVDWDKAGKGEARRSLVPVDQVEPAPGRQQDRELEGRAGAIPDRVQAGSGEETAAGGRQSARAPRQTVAPPPIIRANLETPAPAVGWPGWLLPASVAGGLAIAVFALVVTLGGGKSCGGAGGGADAVAGNADVTVTSAGGGEYGTAGIRWIVVIGGSFAMGAPDGESDERPVHPVTVKSFRMTRSEVTVAQYRECVRTGDCPLPSSGERCNWGMTGRDGNPVNCVDWQEARTFCRWAGGRLPAEAEWEYAARSGGHVSRFPWGDGDATCSRAVMDDGSAGCGREGTSDVCSKASGNTAQDLCDMAGNVWEWVQDSYHSSYEGAPDDGSAWEAAPSSLDRVSRGGGYSSSAGSLRSVNRMQERYTNRFHALGFRCARSFP